MITREEAISQLKSLWNVDELKFLAEFHRPKRPDGSFYKAGKGEQDYGFLRNFSANDREIFYPMTEGLDYNRKIYLKQIVAESLEDGKYYYVELGLEDDSNRSTNPYLLRVKEIFLLEQDHLSPKQFIQNWFYKKGRTPEDAATIAAQLSLNELELYTHTKRFIFELIQNADDMPMGENKPVHINIQLLNDHLLFLHNGKFFDRDDVKAISDAAKSTKAKNLTQTGYKGIGFKSVFTDSNRVYIKSGSYSFKFDKNEPIFSDFKLLYQGYYRSLSDEAKKQFDIEFTGREAEFTNIDRIPWQIKPIWFEFNDLNEELRSSSFVKKYSVAIALQIGSSVIESKDYHSMIHNLLQESRFLLFLRNTSELNYTLIKNNTDISRVNVAVKRYPESLTVSLNDEIISSFVKHDFDIHINNEDFINAGLDFQKREFDNGKFEFYDNDGRKLENIPEKLGMLNQTRITLAATCDKNLIRSLNKDETLLFNYLPTSDQRFGFPFLVNADFVSKTDREFIQIENKWNHFLFYQIGFLSLKWIAKLAKHTHKIDDRTLITYVRTYLNLLPNALLDENNAELGTINNAFNRGFKFGLEKIRFILCDKGILYKNNQVLLDDTGLCRVFGNNFISKISRNPKALPHHLINSSNLRKEYLGIERYSGVQLCIDLKNENNQEIINKYILGAQGTRYFDFMNWLSKFINEERLKPEWVFNFACLRINNEVVSFQEAFNKKSYILRSSKTKAIEDILVKLGFELSEIDFSEECYSQFQDAISTFETYIKSDKLLYEHITNFAHFGSVSSFDKNLIINFFKSLNEIGPTRYAQTLPLFKSLNPNDELKPLKQLISPDISNLPHWLQDFQIDHNDYAALENEFKKELLSETQLLENFFCNEKLFDEVSSILNDLDIVSFYTYILNLHKALPEDKVLDFTKIPLIYSSKSEPNFRLATETYWPDSLIKLNESQYENVKRILETLSDLQLPIYNALKLKEAFNLGSLTVDLPDILSNEECFEIVELNDFLDWASSEVNNDQFINQFEFVLKGQLYNVERSKGHKYFYTENHDIISIINDYGNTDSLKLFPKDLYSDKRSFIGLLEGDKLLLHLIEKRLGGNQLVQHLTLNTDLKVRLAFLDSLEKLEFNTANSFDKSDTIYQIVALAAGTLKDDEELTRNFRTKIVVDGKDLVNHAISADIIFFPEQTKLVVKLDEVLPKYGNETFSIDTITDCFDGIACRFLFKQDHRPTQKIYSELLAYQALFYTPQQALFLNVYGLKNSNAEPFGDKPVLFLDTTLLEEKEIALETFLDLSYRQWQVSEFLPEKSVFGNDFFDKINLCTEYCQKDENPPQWIATWLEKGGRGEREKRVDFLIALGATGETHAVNELRMALAKQEEFEKFKWADITNSAMLINTIYWLFEIQSMVPGSISKIKLKQIYDKAISLGIILESLPIPVRKNLENEEYQLKKIQPEQRFYRIHSSWNSEYSDLLQKHISNNNGILIDDIIASENLAPRSVITGVVSSNIDLEKLESRKPYLGSFYTEWSMKTELKVSLYRGQRIPHKIKLGEITLGLKEHGIAYVLDGELIICESAEEGFPESVREHMSETHYNSLVVYKRDYLKKKKEEINFTDEQIEQLKKLFDEDLPEDYKKNYNLASLVTALESLPDEGFNVDDARGKLDSTHEFAQLSPVTENDSGKEVTVMARSARQGLLYMTQSAWDRLNDNHTYLFTDYGNGDFQLFKSKQDVLDANDKKTDYQIIRIETEANADNVDKILNGEYDKSRIWIIFRVKENEGYDRLFYKKLEPSLEESKATIRVDTSNITSI